MPSVGLSILLPAMPLLKVCSGESQSDGQENELNMNLLQCGHKPSPHGEHTTGTAHPDGREICWDCADEWTRQETAKTLPGKHTPGLYLTESQGRLFLTTWSGGAVLDVTEWRYVSCGGFASRVKRITFKALDSHFRRYYGTSPGIGMYARTRRAK